MEPGFSGPKERRSRAPYFQWVFTEAKGAPTFRSPPGKPERLSLGKFARRGELRGGCPHKGARTASRHPGLARLGLWGVGESGAGDRCTWLAGVTVQGSRSTWGCLALSTRPSFPQATAARAPPELCAPPLPGPRTLLSVSFSNPQPPALGIAGCSTWRGSSLQAGEEASRFVDGPRAWLMWISLKPPVVS